MTTYLTDIMDEDLLIEMVDGGYIRSQFHDSEPLVILNYTEKAQYERVWNEVTLNARGLIYNSETDAIVARGFPKFFNWDDSTQPYPPTGPMLRSTKFDGSLGILYREPYRGFLAVATRGSFASDQAKWATKFLEDQVSTSEFAELSTLLDQDMTPLFEIIYPANRIVVDYHGESRLVLLDVLENATGSSNIPTFDEVFYLDKAEKVFIPGGFADTVASDIPEGEEGFVLFWPGRNFRVKVKSAEYVELHRVITGLSKKTVWQWIKDGKPITELREGVPDELFEWLDNAVADLYDATGAILDKVHEDYETVLLLTGVATDEPVSDDHDALEKFAQENRGRFAREAASFPDTRPFLFKKLDGTSEDVLFLMAWERVKPSGDSRAFSQSNDAD